MNAASIITIILLAHEAANAVDVKDSESCESHNGTCATATLRPLHEDSPNSTAEALLQHLEPFLTLESISGDIRKHLKCPLVTRDAAASMDSSIAPKPDAITKYCQLMRPPGPDCDFDAPAPAPSADATEQEKEASVVQYYEWRSACLHRCFFSTPGLNIVGLDSNGAALVSPMLQTGYKSTPFLDGRSLEYGIGACRYLVQVKQLQHLASWGIDRNVSIARSAAGRRLHFVFHIGHTGATMLTRALDKLEDVFVLREPLLLSWLAKELVNATVKQISTVWQSPVLPWLTRRYRPEQTVVVKAKSSALRFMRPALKSTSATAVFMYSGLRTYLAMCLEHDDENFPFDLDVKGAPFKEFARGSAAYSSLTRVRRLVLAWFKRLCYAKRFPDSQVLHVRMDQYLKDPASHLQKITNLLGLPSSEDIIAAVANSSIYATDAISSADPYTAATHADAMKRSKKLHRETIDEGLEFAKAMLKRHSNLQNFSSLIDK